MRRALAAAASTALVLAPLAGARGEEPAEERPPIVIESIEPYEPPRDPSSQTSVIEAERFPTRAASVADVVSEVPGVQVRRFGGPGEFSSISIRGSSAEQVLVLLDGVRLNSPQRGAVDLSSIPLAQVERIEVTRGGGSAEYGSDAIGGVVNVVTRRAREPFEARASFTSGSFETRGGSLSLSGRRGALDGLVSYDRLQAENHFPFERPVLEFPDGSEVEFSQFPEVRRLNSDFHQDQSLLRVGWEPAPGTRVELIDSFFQRSQGQPGPDLAKGDVPAEEVNCLTADAYSRRNLVTLRATRRDAFREGLDLSASGYQRFESERLSQDEEDPVERCFDTVEGRSRVHNRSFSTGGVLGGSTPLEMPAALPWLGDHFARLDLEARHDSLDADGFDDASRVVGSAFVQDELSWREGRLRLIPGLRLEGSHSQPVDFLDSGTGAEDSVAPDDTLVWIPRLGLVARPWPVLRVRANVERSYRLPSFNELYTPDQGFVRGNPRLDPEDAINYDLGFELALARLGPLARPRLEIVGFWNDVDESIVFQLVSPTLVEPRNTGAVLERGIELATGFEIFSHFALDASYTWLDAEVSETGEQLVNRPRHLASATLSAFTRFGRVWLRTTYTDEQPLTQDGSIFLEQRTLFDAGVSLDLAKLPWLPVSLRERSLVLALEGTNLGDESYRDAAGFPVPGRMAFLSLSGAW